MEIRSKKGESRTVKDTAEAVLMVKALQNTFDLLGGAEKRESLFRFLKNEYGLSLDEQHEINEKTLAAALTSLFGSGAELLMHKLEEEVVRLKVESAKDKAKDNVSGLETLH
jgi:tellurite resistance protein